MVLFSGRNSFTQSTEWTLSSLISLFVATCFAHASPYWVMLTLLSLFSLMFIIQQDIFLSKLNFSDFQRHKAVALISAGFISGWFLLSSQPIFQPFVTIEDRLCFFVLIVYIIYYMMRIAAKMIHKSRIEKECPVNPILATLALVSMRLYFTIDNPYVVCITFMLLVRSIHKIWILEDTCHIW
jgi:hypothetical protein